MSELPQAQKLQIVWFKRDLRVHDHAPLTKASSIGPVLPLYIVEPELWSLPDSSRRHWHFIHDSLAELKERLADLGAPLVFKVGEACKVLAELHQQVGPFTLWSHEETGNNWTYQRDIAVASWCHAHEIKWIESPTNGIVRRLKARDQWATLREARMTSPLEKVPQKVQAGPLVVSDPLPSKAAFIFGEQNTSAVQKGGRKEGIKVLKSFLQERSRHYMSSISRPEASEKFGSRLSPHITFGTLSIREIEQATKKKLASIISEDSEESLFLGRQLQAFLSRLAWHCHFIQKLEQQPEIEFQCMHSSFEGMRESKHNEQLLTAWKTGQTGYPLVDACMRALHANGWINFRMRAMLVSFACYNLWLDWRRISGILAQLFTDYEPGIHYCQLQMQSGVTGINTVRIYNPIKQSIDQDPKGHFIRKYVPELELVPQLYIHEPWKMPTPPANYPSPVVAHEASMRFARQEIAKRWRSEGFRDQAQKINQKLGSRRRPTKTSRKRAHKKSSQQLTFDL